MSPTRSVGLVSLSAALELAETAFNANLNADGVIGLKPMTMSAPLDRPAWPNLAATYFLYPAGGARGPELMLGGTAVVDGTLGGWTPIGAVETASGYEVAFTPPGHEPLYESRMRTATG